MSNIGIADFYNKIFALGSRSNANTVGWISKDDQYVRFKTLLDIGVKNGDTLLDYGCGLGDLVTYLKENNLGKVGYTGIDINERFISKAQDLHPNSNFLLGDMVDNSQYDWVVGSGVFTIQTSFSEVFNKIHTAYRKCRKGVAFNFLIKKPPYHPDVNKYDPVSTIQTLQGYYPQATLIEGYAPDDFTIYIRRTHPIR